MIDLWHSLALRRQTETGDPIFLFPSKCKSPVYVPHPITQFVFLINFIPPGRILNSYTLQRSSQLTDKVTRRVRETIIIINRVFFYLDLREKMMRRCFCELEFVQRLLVLVTYLRILPNQEERWANQIKLKTFGFILTVIHHLTLTI